jgi:hypothetical protein
MRKEPRHPLTPAPFPFNLTPKHVGRDEDEEEKLVSLKKILPLLENSIFCNLSILAIS